MMRFHHALRASSLAALISPCALVPAMAQDNAEPASSASSGDTAGNGDAAGEAAAAGDEGRSVRERVIERARALADSEYSAPESTVPEALAAMDYTQYRGIRFNADASIWADDSPFRVELFHPGFLYDTPVSIHTVSDGQVRTVPFDAGMFRYDDEVSGLDAVAQAAADAEGSIGFAGFRVHFPLNTTDYQDEVMVFLGASYFRLVGPQQNYGISARGLAIDTATPEGEEFPAFRAFWLERPAADSATVTVHALLDSPSVTGAYRFELNPGASTRVRVSARLFAREDIDKLGVAPLTSMFLYGENRTRRRDDFRPEVHDSDGLLVHTGGDEWIWRPLTNPTELRVTSSQGPTPNGFGLLQRDRAFDHYLDMEARYDRRPSLWVEPTGGDWGKGRVELVEIPSDSETNDNIVAYWVPADPMTAGDARTYEYRLRTFGARLPTQPLASVIRTRIGWGAVPGMDDPPPRSNRLFIVDFRGQTLAGLGAGLPVEPVLTTSDGSVSDLSVRRLPGEATWRASFRLSPAGETPADMRLHLALRGERLTETWNYVWYPNDLE